MTKEGKETQSGYQEKKKGEKKKKKVLVFFFFAQKFSLNSNRVNIVQ